MRLNTFYSFSTYQMNRPTIVGTTALFPFPIYLNQHPLFRAYQPSQDSGFPIFFFFFLFFPFSFHDDRIVVEIYHHQRRAN
ncbi:hypothetical protein F4778DRAFT_347703 [Xylariomycetidae sp. FL2044]|nr:hypothetical protein F4778DRAFT_347703 [Xylariomycetidae sp. FL2044]